jgi:hypothetical protein
MGAGGAEASFSRLRFPVPPDIVGAYDLRVAEYGLWILDYVDPNTIQHI